MPKIYIHGCDTTKQIEHITISVDVWMKPELYKNALRAREKLNELSKKLEEVVAEYFPHYNEPEIFLQSKNCPY